MGRRAEISRKTHETDIRLALELDGSGASTVQTGIGFFDHMLTLLARHGLFDLEVHADGDLEVDGHHTVEDVGICLGMALCEALGEKVGIRRYGSVVLPMEETLVTAAVDLSGRAWFVQSVTYPTEKIGEFDTQLVEVFWQAVSANSRINPPAGDPVVQGQPLRSPPAAGGSVIWFFRPVELITGLGWLNFP